MAIVDDIPLDEPVLPEWLVRFHSLSDLADEGMRLAQQTRIASQSFHRQFPGSFDTAGVIAWLERAVGTPLPDEQAALVAGAKTAGEAAAKAFALSPNTDSISELIRSVDDAAEAIQKAGGKLVRDRGQHAIALALVGELYRGSHTAIYQFSDGRPFGIDDKTLSRFLTRLLDEDIFASGGRGSDIVRLTDHGRRWFEREISGGGQQTADAEDARSWSDARSDVMDAASHLEFMASEDLRAIVLSLLAEIDITVRAGAPLATMVLCGSAVETMLLDLAEQIPNKLSFANKPNWAETVSLPKILDELRVHGLVGETTRGLTVANHRDLVHSNRRRKAEIRIDPKGARAMALLVAIIAHDLHDAVRSGALAALKT